MWRRSDGSSKRFMAWTAMKVPRPWLGKLRELSGWALLARIAGGEFSWWYGRGRRVGFATERVMRGADGGEVAEKERRYGQLWRPQCSVSGKTIRAQCTWSHLAASNREGGESADEEGPQGSGKQREREEREKLMRGIHFIGFA